MVFEEELLRTAGIDQGIKRFVRTREQRTYKILLGG
jgi:hypothetical protein